MIEKIKNHLLNGVLILLLFSSCKKEVSLEIQQDNQANFNELKSLVTQVKTWHDSTVSSNLSTKVQNGVRAFCVNENDIVPPIVDWEKAFINYDSSSIKSITVPISMNYKNGERIQLVATKSKGKLKGYFIKITPDRSYFAKQNEIYDYNNFSGSITIYNLMGVRLKKQDFKSGEVTNSNNNNKAGLSNITAYGDGFNTANDLLTVTVQSKKRKKYQFNYGYIYIEELQNIELEEGDGGGGVIAGGDESSDELFKIKNKIINPCLSSLVDKIINSKLSDQLNKDLKNVFGVNNKVNLIFEEAILDRPAKSLRNFSNPDNYTIYLDLSKFDPNVSEEFVASAIVHEISHMLIANTFSDYEIYQRADREKIMLDNYVNLMQSFLVKNFKLLDKQALSMIYVGMMWLTDKPDPNNGNKGYKFWSQETENYYRNKIKESGFNEIMNDPECYTYFNAKFSEGTLGTNPCKF
jgi:hypothetical protein